MANLNFITTFLLFVGILIFFIGAFIYLNYRLEHHKLMKKLKHEGSGQILEDTSHSSSFFSQSKELFSHFLRKIGNAVKPKKEGDVTRLQKKLAQAGYRAQNAAIFFFGVKAFCSLTAGLVFSMMQLFLVRLTYIQIMLFIIVAASIGFYLPDFWVRLKIVKRKDRISRGFPDTLDLLVVCVEAGMGLDAALYRVSQEMKLTHKEISEEFQVLNRELRAGKARLAALRNLSLRIGLDDVKSLVTLLIQTDRFGTSIAQALRVYADTMRTKRQNRAEEAAAKIPVKLLFPLIFCIFPSLFIAILGPAIIQIWRLKHGG